MKSLNRLLFLVFLSSLLILTGCNTVEGIGRDIQEAGSSIQDAAQK